LDCLCRYNWPGNIRELRNVIERVMILENREEIDETDLPQEILQAANPDIDVESDAGEMTDGAAGRLFQLPPGGVPLRAVQRGLVRQALDATGGNQTKAARLLHISRDTLRYKMKIFGLP
jgi:DNA-binding NtrC family response regulator